MFICISVSKRLCFSHLLCQYFSFPTEGRLLFFVPLYHQAFQSHRFIFPFHSELHKWRAWSVYPQIPYIGCSDWHKVNPQQLFDFGFGWNIIFNIPYFLHATNSFTWSTGPLDLGSGKGWEEDSRRHRKRPKQKGNWEKQQVADWKPPEMIFVLPFCLLRATWSLGAQTSTYQNHHSLQKCQNAQCPCYTTPRPATPRGYHVPWQPLNDWCAMLLSSGKKTGIAS